jgi:hypothetical protein
MLIQIVRDETQSYGNLGTQVRYVQMTSGRHSVLVAIETGRWPRVNVVVQNAAHRVWRGAGRYFPTLAEAADHYKTPEIRAMVRHAAEV